MNFNGWSSGKLSDVTVLITDGTHHSPATTESGEFLYLTSKNVRENRLDLTDVSYVTKSLHDEIYKRCPVQRGDVLFVKDGANTGLAAENTLDQPFSLLSSVALIRPVKEQLHSRYLVHWLNSPNGHYAMTRNMSGSAIRRLILDQIKKTKIPLPPLSEQKRIADILDKADAIRRKRQEALNEVDKLYQATFEDIIGNPVVNPKKWPRIQFSELIDEIESGWSPSCLDRQASEDEWGVLKLGAVTYCRYDPSENKALPRELTPRPELEAKQGDVLMTRKNTFNLVAACAYVWKTPPKLMLPDLVFRFKLSDHSLVMPLYLWGLFTHPSKRRSIQSIAGGTAGSMPNISKGRLLQQQIEVPPMDLQEKYAQAVTEIFSLTQKKQVATEEAETLFNALVQRAFKGEL